MKRVLAWYVATVMAVAATAASAAFHLFTIQQVYSNADGSVQFIVLRSPADFENLWAGRVLTSMGPGGTQTYTFATDLPSVLTANKRVLIATEGFAALGLITPDYVIPNRFISIPSGSIDFAAVSSVSYSALPSDGTHAIDFRGNVIQNVATNFAGQSASVSPSTTPPPPPPTNYGGLWWKSPGGSESGWGINFAHQGDLIFATWYTYDANGKAWWLTMTAAKSAPGVYSGDLTQYRGPAFSAVPFTPSAIVATKVGTGMLTFSDRDNGTFAYTVNGIAQQKPLTRFAFASLPTCTFGAQSNLALATNFQDIWWAAPGGVESGWGVNFTHQGDTIVAAWFTYDVDGSPLWLLAALNKTAANTYTGTLSRSTGPAFSAVPFLPANVVSTAVGTLTLTFAHGNSATYAYTVSLSGPGSAVTQQKTIERTVFSAPGTVCQ